MKTKSFYCVAFSLLSSWYVYGQPGANIPVIKPELIPTLVEMKKRNAELDSIYALIDEGTIKDEEIADQTHREIDDRMRGGWGDSNYPDSIFASSTLPPQGNYTYYPKNAFDYKESTAWIEANTGYGEGEFLAFRFPKFRANEPLTTITIYNGYHRNEGSWQQNSRIKIMRVYNGDTPVADLSLTDTMRGQRFKLNINPKGDNAIIIKLEIREVYPGLKWKDTGITEIQFDGIWQGI